MDERIDAAQRFGAFERLDAEGERREEHDRLRSAATVVPSSNGSTIAII
jgi:hypothetical protein